MSEKQDAQRIAKHFISSTAGRATPAIMKKTIAQAKTLLQSGYTPDEIIRVIDYLINERQIEIYSLGYVVHSINDVLRTIRERELDEEKEKAKAFVKEEQEKFQLQSEVVSNYDNSESTERNQNKAGRFGVQSRLGEESFSDLFAGE